MPAVLVPDLKEKFRLLRTYTARTDWSQLAEPFGASHKTLQYWAQGSGSREPDLVPQRAVPVLIDLIADMLPPGRSEEEVRRLVFGPVARLEEEVRSGTGALISSIIESEGRTGSAILIRGRDHGALVEADEAPAAGWPVIAAGAPFRLEFRLRRGTNYAAVLQNAQHVWAVLASERVESASSNVLVPGLGSGGVPSLMRERRDYGLHRFVCLETTDPFPAWLAEHRREGTILDKRGLEALARFYLDVSGKSRACHVLSLVVEPASP